MYFSSDFIDKIKNHSLISEVIGKRIAVKRHGRLFEALCPFHNEKTPSFKINNEKNFFHCFGCGAGGDAITFVKDYEKISYPEAIKKLADEFGIAIPQTTPANASNERKKNYLEQAISLAENWFFEQLNSNVGYEAREYLKQRGIENRSIKNFAIGFAPDSKDLLHKHLIKQGINEKVIIAAGLASKADDGTIYDRFRARVIFPIRNLQGKTVAFGGRILPSASKTKNIAKYLNSPETDLFKKGELLFAYDFAVRSAREKNEIIVVEGYLDVISLHQNGFTNAVAPLGTAITEFQLKLLWRTASQPIICLDGDSAGKKAMMRAADLALPLLEPEISLRFALLPQGEDPDSLIKKSGNLAMQQVLSNAKILSQVLWESAFSHFGVATAEQKSALEQYLIKNADIINNNIVKQHIKSFFREKIYSLGQKNKIKKKTISEIKPAPLPETNDYNKQLKIIEDNLFMVVLMQPDILYHSEIEEHFGRMEITQASLDKLRTLILEVVANNQSINHNELCEFLAARGFSEKVEELLHSKISALSINLSPSTNISEFVQAFERGYSDYVIKKVDIELIDAANLFEKEGSEQNQTRLLALQKQKEEMIRSIYAVKSDDKIF